MPRQRQLTADELELLRAQTEATQQEAALRAAQTEDIATERAQRAEALRQAGVKSAQEIAESQAKVANVQEMTPFEKLLKLAGAGAPEMTARTAKIGAAIDLMKLRDAARTERERSQGGIAQQLIQSRPDLDPSTLAAAIKGVYPGLGEALTTAQAAATQKKAAALISTIPALRKSGQLEKVIPSLQADPEVYKLIEPHLRETPTTGATPTTIPTELTYPFGQSREMARPRVPLLELLKNVPISWGTPKYR